ncbi:HNH endonuclease [Bradyrhizobium sp. Ce-3]|uniref:HNH endonuclease n=1 Tax=Bradyrhizobium sp. Ce-3 TaxID=2913970 RepID=UPI001FC8E018|nr:HNH endonuclease [Bradyrhizobium sp. Ce-3]
MEAGLPPLTAIVVSKSQRRPGSGFVAWDIDDLESGITLVYGEDWAAKANPFLGFGENETFETLARELINDPGASEAIYRRVKDRGIAQKIFREALIIAYDHQCAMCDLSFYDALEAAHIVPFWECSAEQKMDVCNGLLLCANHHRLFDTEWITVSADHVIQFSDPNMRDGPYSKSDIAASVGLHGTKVRCPADPKLRPKFPSRDTD